jgi:class 3 adenylate cyclase
LRDPPTGTVTFLFTDIEGSTRRWQDEPDVMRALLVEHDAILRDVIDKNRGHLFKHTGDGVAAVFSSASDAVKAAVEAQARLRDVLPVRMGLHTGEAELRDGDYFGSTLNRCARLMSMGHGGQVVCSAATAELVRERDDLRDLGEHRLRDLSRAERVWQVGGGEFAALRSLDTARTNLPLQLSWVALLRWRRWRRCCCQGIMVRQRPRPERASVHIVSTCQWTAVPSTV